MLVDERSVQCTYDNKSYRDCLNNFSLHFVAAKRPIAKCTLRSPLYTGLWYVANCGQQQGFICKKAPGNVTPTTPPPTLPTPGYCPAGYFEAVPDGGYRTALTLTQPIQYHDTASG